MMSPLKPVCLLALLTTAVGLIGCSMSNPVSASHDSLDLFLTPRDIEILGPARGITERFQFLGYGFGSDNSFVQAERKAYEEKGGDLLIGRIRVKSFEGLMIPGFWLAWFGFENEPDFPIVGMQVYTTGGTAVKIKSWHKAVDARIEQDQGAE